MFRRYLNLILVWNRVHNIVGTSDSQTIVRVLFQESLLFHRLIPRGRIRLADVGSGAGFPGIPLRIVEPEVRVTLVEVRRKKVSFLSALRRELAVDDVLVWHGRAEELSREQPGFDVVTMRAVASPERCLDIGLPLLSATGKLVASVRPETDLGPVTPVQWASDAAAEVIMVEGIEGEHDRKFLVATRSGAIG
jgi:16S rRNA (guanine527-N7)-methyltransferase